MSVACYQVINRITDICTHWCHHDNFHLFIVDAGGSILLSSYSMRSVLMRLCLPIAVFSSLSLCVGLVVFMYTSTPTIPIVWSLCIVSFLTVLALCCMTFSYNLYSRISIRTLSNTSTGNNRQFILIWKYVVWKFYWLFYNLNEWNTIINEILPFVYTWSNLWSERIHFGLQYGQLCTMVYICDSSDRSTIYNSIRCNTSCLSMCPLYRYIFQNYLQCTYGRHSYQYADTIMR